MKPDKILYVDDEPMALKYFERLVSPLAPVLTATSVEAGKAVLRDRGGEIAVLVSDQRMPGAHGNELLRYARDRYPGMVRMLTTAYSELGEAIEAINSGEIYRYITKPWDLESLRADLKNALELASLRSERDDLMREKLLVQQAQLLAARVTHLAIACAGFVREDCAPMLAAFLDAAEKARCGVPPIDWSTQDHADLMQAEAFRAVSIGALMARWQATWFSAAGTGAPLTVLAAALPGGSCEMQGDRLLVRDRTALTWVLEAATSEAPSAERVAWPAWLLWRAEPVAVAAAEGGWLIGVQAAADPGAPPLAADWMADAIEKLSRGREV